MEENMKFGIIGAMDEEIEYLRTKMTATEEHEIASVLLIEGKLADKQVVLLKSGIGKVNAAMATTILIERFQPTHIINTGSAGGMKERLNVGDIVIGDEIVHHDVDVTAFNYSFGQVPNMPATFHSDYRLVEWTKHILEQLDLTYNIGLIATGDSFMSDPDRVSSVKVLFPAMLTEI